jgi:hypothetical protein
LPARLVRPSMARPPIRRASFRRTAGSPASPRLTIRRSSSPCSSSAAPAHATPRRSPPGSSATSSASRTCRPSRLNPRRSQHLALPLLRPDRQSECQLDQADSQHRAVIRPQATRPRQPRIRPRTAAMWPRHPATRRQRRGAQVPRPSRRPSFRPSQIGHRPPNRPAHRLRRCRAAAHHRPATRRRRIPLRPTVPPPDPDCSTRASRRPPPSRATDPERT